MCWAGDKPSVDEVVTTARRFVLVRHRDLSGVSGTGVVADGCEFPNGKIALAWRGKRPSVAVFDSMLALLDVHSHKGATEVRFVDDWHEMTRTALGLSEKDQRRPAKSGRRADERIAALDAEVEQADAETVEIVARAERAKEGLRDLADG